MNNFDAKEILQLYRPGSADARNDEQVAEALTLAQSDPELGTWLAQHDRFQIAMREKFLEIPVPPHLKESILAETKIIRPQPWWRDRGLARLAASICLLVAIGFGVNTFWKKSRVPDRFADYESRMVRSALREYHMDIVTNNLTQVRQLMASHGAPSDFSIPKGLSQRHLTGGGVLRWRNNPVTMVCFNRGDSEMLFLFVMNRAAVKDPPRAKPEVERVNKLIAARWSEGDKTYLLAGPEEIDFLQKYF